MTESQQTEIEQGPQKETYKFDHRTKTLVRRINNTGDVMLSGVKAGAIVDTSVQTYDEEGIKLLVQELKLHRDNIAKKFIGVNQTLDATKHIEKTDEMDKFVEMMGNIQNYQKRMQAEHQREQLLDDLEMSKKQYKAVVDAVGEHMKFE